MEKGTLMLQNREILVRSIEADIMIPDSHAQASSGKLDFSYETIAA